MMTNGMEQLAITGAATLIMQHAADLTVQVRKLPCDETDMTRARVGTLVQAILENAQWADSLLAKIIRESI